MLVILLYVLLIGLFTYGITINSERKEILSKRNTDALKGLFCIFVVLSHMVEYSPYLYIVQLVFICVFCFFMFSGYGLTVSYAKCEYLDRKRWFCKQIRRIAKLIVPLMVVAIIEIFLNVPIYSGVGYWIFVISVFYLLYGILAVVIKNKKWTYISMIFISLFYSLFCQFVLHYGTLWPAQELGFAVGVGYGVHKEKIEGVLRKNTIWIFMSSIIIFLITAVTYVIRYSGEHDIRVLSSGMYLGRIIMQGSALLIIFTFLLWFQIGNRITIFIGKHLSMYIFILHGLILELTKLRGMGGEACIAFVLTVTICVSIFVDFMVRKISDKLTNYKD